MSGSPKIRKDCTIFPMFSIDFQVDVGSWDIDVEKTKCQQHIAETRTLTELKKALQFDK